MKLRLPSFSLSNAGFTMIELLVVIAVIGVLAVAVLSSINPIEQINKGRDTRSRSDAAQLINAVDRYFSIHEVYPWNVETADWVPADEGSTDDYAEAFDFDETGTITGASTNWGWANILATTAEVKSAFVSRISQEGDSTDFFVSKAAGGNTTMYVCYRPSSYAFALEAKNRCGNTPEDDYPAEACPEACVESADVSTEPGQACFVCLP